MAILIWREQSMPSRKRPRPPPWSYPNTSTRSILGARRITIFKRAGAPPLPARALRWNWIRGHRRFWAAYRKAQGTSSPTVNTVDLVIDEYLRAVAPTLSASAFDHYQRALGIAKRAWGPLPIEGLRPSHVKKLMDGIASTPARANQFLSVMKVLSGWAIVSEKITQSLTEGVKPYKTTGGHKPWS